MSSKKTEHTMPNPEKPEKNILARMENGRLEVMKAVEGVPGSEKLVELFERGKKKGNLSATELMEVLEDMDIGSEQRSEEHTSELQSLSC